MHRAELIVEVEDSGAIALASALRKNSVLPLFFFEAAFPFLKSRRTVEVWSASMYHSACIMWHEATPLYKKKVSTHIQENFIF